MLKSLGKQIKNEKIRVVFKNILDFLGTIKEDRYLTTEEKHIIDKNIGKKQNGELFTKDEIKKITEMLKSLGKQIKNEKIRVVFFKNILDVLMTIEKDQVLTTEGNAVIDKKQKMGSSYFTPTPRSQGRSRADVEAENKQIEKECPICRNEYDEEKCNPQPLECNHKMCKSCVDDMTEPNEEIKCPFCRLRSKSPAASARGMSAASARGPPRSSSSLRPAGASWTESTVDTIFMILGFYFSIWVLYVGVWKIDPATLDFSGFMRTQVGALLTCALIILAAHIIS